MRKQNKKGQLGHAVIWLHKFFILVLVIGGVVAVVTAHYSKQYDIRDVEASVVARNIAECVAPNGIIKEFSEDAVRNCLSLDEEEIYIHIIKGNENITIGDSFLLTLCEAKEKKVKVKYHPSCLEEKYYVLEDNQEKNLGIFLAIKKIEKNL